MGREHSSGQQFLVGDRIKGYEILKVFDAGSYTFSGQARAPNGKVVFFKKYRRPGGTSPWQDDFISYQAELKRRIQAEPSARSMCYEFVEFFDLSLKTKFATLRAFYQVFEWIEGGSDLRKLLKAPGAAPSWGQKVLFAKMLAAGVNAIHRTRVIHADLKPENFYLIPDPALASRYKLRVIDMDSSVLEDKRAPWHGSEGYVGSPGYMSPEHLRGQVPGKHSDAFTCGLILSELLCGRHPFAGHTDSDDAYRKAVEAGRFKPIDIPEPIDRVVDLGFLNAVLNGCLRPEATRRPGIEQVLQALNGALDGWDGLRPRSSSSVPSPGPAPVPVPAPPPPVPPLAPRPAPPPVSPALRRVTLSGPGEPVTIGVPTILGRAHFKGWGSEFERFVSNEQFRLYRDGSGNWMIEHCAGAVNVTNVDGSVLAAPVPVRSGMSVSVGRTGKCPFVMNLID
jgi:serine/threonine protein kinase